MREEQVVYRGSIIEWFFEKQTHTGCVCSPSHQSGGMHGPRDRKHSLFCWHRALHTSYSYGALLPHTNTHTQACCEHPAKGRNVAHTFGHDGWKQLGCPAKERQMEMVSNTDDQTLVSSRGAGD